MLLEDGKSIECTADHRFLFAKGWRSLREAVGLRASNGRAVWDAGEHSVYVNGHELGAVAPYRDRPWLNEQYNVLCRRIEDIAQAADTSYHTIRKWLIRHGLQEGECHPRVAGNELDCVARLGGPPVKAHWKRKPRSAWNKLTTAKRALIVGFVLVGELETYDLEVDGPFHNFIANGIVTHNSVNEYSTRYSVAIDAAQRTGAGEWRIQAAGNRQGSAGFLPEAEGAVLSRKEDGLHADSRALYEERLKAGVAREQARKDLPLSTYTEAYWKVDLHNLLHFLALRMDDHAQEEIRAYANVIGHEIVGKWCPMAWEAFLDYRVNALQLSRLEAEVVRALGAGDAARALDLARGFGWLAEGPKGLKRSREREELARKLQLLNLPVPWREVERREDEEA
jgi:flavin-dependent thymidylate synthase